MEEGFDIVPLWAEGWQEDGLGSVYYGMGVVTQFDFVEREDTYVEVQDYDKLLEAYKELKWRIEGLEK